MIGFVRVYRGRWVVDCPATDCSCCPSETCAWVYNAITPWGDARYQHACIGTPSGPFAGPGCGTRIDLAWPTPDEAEAIVEVLAKRPVINRNWHPNETVDQLIAENDRYLVGCDLEWLAEQGIGVVL